LIISVGGDGTFLDAARNAKKTPVLGVNSDIHYSVGQFCSTDLGSFKRALNGIVSGKTAAKKVHRLQISINGKAWPYPVLNDILACHSSPAAMSHYVIKINSISERHRGSGVWVSTAAGSTGAIKSAGGKKLGLEDKKFQYMPREIFEGHGVKSRLRGGILGSNQKVTLTSQMQKGVIYIDGAHTMIPWRFGDVLTIKLSKYPLQFLKMT
jgi:NAD+ kinase